MSFESIVELVDKNKTSISSNDYLKIMNSLKNIYDIKNSNHGIIKCKNNEEEEEEDINYNYIIVDEDEDTYASLWK
jgi:hypothetical protein